MINYYWIVIKGKNSKYFLYNIFKNRISIADIKYRNDEILLKVSYDQYKMILSINTSCTISILKTVGIRRVEQLYQKYKVSLIIFVISLFFIIFLSSFILFINIESNNSSINNVIKRELIYHNITPFAFKKSYKNLKDLSSDIKNNNLDKMEWVELEQKGVFLNVKVIPRIKNDTYTNSNYNDIVALRNGYIKRIESTKGQILKNIDDYVKKGEVIISGNIFRNDKVVGKVKADGKVYAEVWYLVKINQDLTYIKSFTNNKGNAILSIVINNKEIKLIKIPKKVIAPSKRVLFYNDLFSIVLSQKKKYIKKSQTYTSFEIQSLLEQKAKNSILNTFKDDEYIISQKTLKKYVKNGKMYIEVFFKCYQDIAEEKALQKIKEKKDGLND